MSEPQAASTGKPEAPKKGAPSKAAPEKTETAKAETASTGVAAAEAAAKPVRKGGHRPAGRGGANAVAAIALIAAVGALGGGYYLWQQQQQTRAALAATEAAATQRLEQLRGALEGAIRRQGESLMTTTADADARTDAQVAELTRAVEHLRQAIGRDGDAWIGAEVQHLLRIANARLQLAGDMAAAVVALETADQRLAALGDPAYTPVREAIAHELRALRATGEADLAGIALKVTGLIEAVDRLPMAGPYAGDRPPAAPLATADAPREVSDWRGFLAALWADIRGLVTIRRADQGAVPALLPPAQQLHLRQNLVLKLETARLALLNRQGEVYHAALNEAAAWLRSYFAVDTPAVGEAIASVDALAKLPVERELPDISGSLRTLDRIERRLRQGDAQAERAP
jgi:uroporphyrin-3 C-methyltransferase